MTHNSEDFDDLKYKFDFTKVTMEELLGFCSWSSLALANPNLAPMASIVTLAFAKKVSVTDVSKIPADMTTIFVKEMTEAFVEWAKETGLVK